MHDEMRVVAGECTATFDDGTERVHRGEVLAVVKPDNTVLVHDAGGYQPAAWLTRAESVQFVDGTIAARDGDQRLRVEVHDERAHERHPVSPAGVPVGGCPDCGGTLVLAGGTVRCLDCAARYGVPRDAAVVEESCESLDAAVRAAFDREWDCPACGSDLRVLRRGGLIAGCERYPDCDTGFALPTGVVAGACDCGLPTFETPTGRRCLDADCDAT